MVKKQTSKKWFFSSFFLNEERTKEIKAICQPKFFALVAKCKTHLTKNSGSHQIAVCHRTIQDVAKRINEIQFSTGNKESI